MTDEAKALVEWFDKTKWVQDSVQPHELGLHRADVLRNRIETQAREIERLRGDLEVARKEAGSNYRVALAWERTARAALGDSHD